LNPDVDIRLLGHIKSAVENATVPAYRAIDVAGKTTLVKARSDAPPVTWVNYNSLFRGGVLDSLQEKGLVEFYRGIVNKEQIDSLAIELVRNVGEKAGQTLPENIARRESAVKTLDTMHEMHINAVKRLWVFASSGQAAIQARILAANRLAILDPTNEFAIPFLLEEAKSTDSAQTAVLAIEALHELGMATDEHVARLESIASENIYADRISLAAAEVLVRMERGIQTASVVLNRILKTSRLKTEQIQAGLALVSIGNAEAAESLVGLMEQTLDQNKIYMLVSASDEMLKHKLNEREAKAFLIKTQGTKDAGKSIRALAHKALWQLDKEHDMLEASMIDLLREETDYPMENVETIGVMVELGIENVEFRHKNKDITAMDFLTPLLVSADIQTRMEAAKVLMKADPGNPKAVATLKTIIMDIGTHEIFRVTASRIYTDLAEENEKAIEALTQIAGKQIIPKKIETLVDTTEVTETVEFAKALGQLNKVIQNGEPLRLIPGFNLGSIGYKWGQEVKASYILAMMGAQTPEEKVALARKFGIDEADQVAELLVGAGTIDLGEEYMQLPVAVLSLFADEVFGKEHVAQIGTENGITAKVLTSGKPLSVQLHSFDEMIVPLEDGTAYIGLKQDVTAEDFMEACKKGKALGDYLQRVDIKAGVPILVPAYTPHAYGVVEVYEAKAVTPEEDKGKIVNGVFIPGTISFFDRLKFLGEDENWDNLDMTADELLERNPGRAKKDVLTMNEEQLAQTLTALKIAENRGLLKKIDIETLKFQPVQVVEEKGVSFEIVGATDRFLVAKYELASGFSMDAPAFLKGRQHPLLVASGTVQITTESGLGMKATAGQTISPIALGKSYSIEAIDGPAVVFTQVKPLEGMESGVVAQVAGQSKVKHTVILDGVKEGPEAESAAAQMSLSDASQVMLTDSGATFERVRVLEDQPYTLDVLQGREYAAFVFESGEAVTVLEDGKPASTLEKGVPVILPIKGDISLSGTGVVKVMYPQSKDEEPVFAVLKGIKSLIDQGTLQAKFKEDGKKGLQIMMTTDLASAIYKKGSKGDAGHRRNEEEFLAEESLLSKHLGIDVRITTGRTWEQVLAKRDENYRQVAWSTDGEMKDEVSKGAANQPVLSALSSLPLVPIASSIIRDLESGEGWFYSRELEGLSLMLACTDKVDIAEKTSAAEELLTVINTMISSPLESIDDLRDLLPLDETDWQDDVRIAERINNIIQNILITLPARRFDPREELHKRRQVLWSA